MNKFSTLLVAFVAAVSALAQTQDYFTPYKQTALRLPSVPLLVNDPYFSFWSPYDNLTDGTIKHWDNQQKAMDGLLRVDGQIYRFMGKQRDCSLEPIAAMGNKGYYSAKVKLNVTTAPTDWETTDFDDSKWTNGRGPWGTKSDYSTVQTAWSTVGGDIYIRRHVTLTEEQVKSDLWLMYSHDDVCQAYINGVQVVSTEETWSQYVRQQITGAAKQSLVAGDNVIAFHVHNTTGGALADIGIYLNTAGYHHGLTSIAPMADEGPWDAKIRTISISGTTWTKTTYNDASWATKQGAFGSADQSNINTSWTATNSDIYIRRHITLTADDLQKNLVVIFSHDDVCEVYLNGRQITSTGETWVNNVECPLSAAQKSLLVEGDNVLAFHVHNTTGGANADIGLYADEMGETTATQTACYVLPTQTYYNFTCGPVDLNLVFTAPFLMDDIEKMSTPINYISYQVKSNDGAEHDVQFYYGTTPELTVNNNSQPTVSTIVTGKDGMKLIKSGSKAQNVLGTTGDLITIDWGYLYIPDVNGTISVAHPDSTNATFASTGKLPASTLNYASTEECEFPTLAYVHDFGKVTDAASSYMMFGYDEVKDMRYMDVDYKGYWARDGKTIQQAFVEFRDGYDDIMSRCYKQDQVIYDDGVSACDAKYAEILCASYRHCIAAHKMFQDNKGNLLFFSKENNSNGCVNTVDLTYPSSPLFLIYNTDLMKGMCTSIFEYCQSSRWGFGFAAHDLGTYPHANNQVYSIRFPDSNGGFSGNMPIEESGNLVILAAAISLIDGNMDWANKYWTTITTWANYLAENGQDPANQLCTDDFAGHLAHNANLSVKAIMGVAGYALMCQLRGDQTEYETYMAKAKAMADQWKIDAKEGSYYKLAFDQTGTWSQKYNMIWDKVWQLHLFDDVIKTEVNYYRTKQKTYGLPLDSRETYTKSDWVSWTATLSSTNIIFKTFIYPLWKYINETPTRVPLSDWYYTGSGVWRGFRARSVIGGHWMKVLCDKVLNGELGTGIQGVLAPTDELDESANPLVTGWYNLGGQKLPTVSQQHGILIHDGRKVLVP